MESRTDFVRLLEEIDKVLAKKKEELAELDDRLDVAREKVAQNEANEIQRNADQIFSQDSEAKDPYRDENIRNYIAEQKRRYQQQLDDFASKLSELEQMNQELRNQNHELTSKEELKETQKQQLETSYYALMGQYQELERDAAQLRQELVEAAVAASQQQIQLDKANQLDKVLEDVYLNKLESLKKAIQLKDEEIERLRLDNRLTLESVGIGPSIDLDWFESGDVVDIESLSLGEKHRLIQVAAMIRERDSQIESLKNQLSDATQELEKSASLIESMTNREKIVKTESLLDEENDFYGSESDYKSTEDKIVSQEGSSEKVDQVKSQQLETSTISPVEKKVVDSRLEGKPDKNGSEISEATMAAETKDRTIDMEQYRMEELLNLQRQVSQLEDQNMLLELAMKEILLSIKWADTQCGSLLIDCPSLERLCHYIETKYVVGSRTSKEVPHAGSERLPSGLVEESSKADIFQLVLLKSELDLLRGQNEQLRADIKTQRREYKDLLCNNTSTELSAREVECQTELNPGSGNTPVDEIKSSSTKVDVKSCESCAPTIRSLVQGIARLETRVAINDDNYMTRFESWNQLIRSLLRDLSETGRSLNESRKECHVLRQQKFKAESKLELLEQMVLKHHTLCPMTKLTSIEPSMSVHSTCANIPDKSIRSLTTGSGKSQIELQTRNANLIITLLKSIIGCLQARLTFKDKRIEELETMVTHLKFNASPA